MPTDKTNPHLRILIARIALGLVYGALLYWAAEYLNRRDPLYGFEEGEAWNRFIGIGRLIAWLGPLPLLFGLGRMKAVRLALWSSSAVLLLFAFGWFGPANVWEAVDGIINVSLFSLIVLFILHEFIQSAADDNRLIASYGVYFGNAWGRGFQVVLSLVFLGAYWVVISLGAWMFDLIGLGFIRRAIFSSEFGWITSGLVFAVGAHLAGADIGLTRGARQIGLMLLSWLAVLMTAILAAFLIALFFTGLQPLWDTGRATVLLLNAAATMIFLINAAYQDGGVANTAFMRATIRFAAIPLAGIVGLAALGLWLRVDQYGLTPARVLACAELLIVFIYAAGYLFAAVKPRHWMAQLEPVNIGAAIVVAVILAGLMTPVLSPARLSVGNQLSRLESGRVEPDEFDFGFLASPRAGQYGPPALERLAARSGSARDDRIAMLAQNPGERRPYGANEQTISSRRGALRLVGEGEIPDGVVVPRDGDDPIEDCLAQKQIFDENVAETEEILALPERLRPENYTVYTVEDRPLADGRCLVRLADVDFDGDDDALVIPHNARSLFGAAVLLQETAPAWRFIGETAARPRYTDEAAHSLFRSLRDQERKDAIADWFEEAVPVAAPHIDLISLDMRLQPRLDERVLSAVEMRERLSMKTGETAPRGLPFFGDVYSYFGDCSRPGAVNDGGAPCFGRYFELTEDARDEFVMVRIAGGWISLMAFEQHNEEWILLGQTQTSADDAYEAIETSLGIDSEASLEVKAKVDAAFRDAFMNDLQPAPALSGDLYFGGIQVAVDYADDENWRRPRISRRRP